MKPSIGRVVVGIGLILLLSVLLVLSSKKVSKVEAQGSPDPLHPVETFSADSTARTLAAAFTQANIAYYPEDVVQAFPDPAMGLGTVIRVERATPVTVHDGKRTIQVRTWKKTVGEILSEKRLDLGNEDRVGPTAATLLQPNMTITITRVARTTVSEFETISYQTLEQDDPSNYRGTKTVTQEGKNGKREKQFLLIREDGELISKTLTSNKIVEAVQNKIVKIGTKLKIGKTLSGKATWYQNSYGTKVAMDAFKKGVEVRITNLNNGKSIIVRNDGCICGATGVLVDLSPEYFQQLGGTLGQGVLSNIRVEEILQ